MSPLHFADLDDLDPVDEYLHTEDILCTVEEVEHHLQTLDVSKANGPDGIPAPSVTNLFNLCLKSGCFPTFWKLSHIVPIPKSNDHTNPSNYQPISLLSILSKVLECHIHKVLTDHLSQHCLLSEKQWDFKLKYPLLWHHWVSHMTGFKVWTVEQRFMQYFLILKKPLILFPIAT